MNAEWIEHLGLGAGVALLASVALLLMVYRELAPSGGLSGRGRLLLTAGVGLGALAFATKVAALALMVALPEATLAPLAAWRGVQRPQAGPPRPRPGPPPAVRRYAWEALPGFAPGLDGHLSTPALVALGKRLFHDKSLSRDRSVACASCHDVEAGAGVDGRRVSKGIGGQFGTRNAPTVWNAVFQDRLFWDGRAPSLEAQAKGPPVNPLEMGMHSLAAVAARVAENPAYRGVFPRAFGAGARGGGHTGGDAGGDSAGDEPVSMDAIVAAIAAYERTLIAADTPYDRFLAGDRAALDAAQQRGMALFESVGCVVCHQGPNFSSASRFDARAPYRLFPAYANPYTRRYRLADDAGRLPANGQRGLWRVPSLRNVALTAPYFHNGAVTTLEEAVRVMATAQLGRQVVATPVATPVATLVSSPDAPATMLWSPADRALHRIQGRALGEAAVRDIAAFLRALSSDRLAAGLGRKARVDEVPI